MRSLIFNYIYVSSLKLMKYIYDKKIFERISNSFDYEETFELVKGLEMINNYFKPLTLSRQLNLLRFCVNSVFILGQFDQKLQCKLNWLNPKLKFFS